MEHPSHEPNQPSQYEQDSIARSRVISDANLLQRGATYGNGVLRLTLEQIDEIRRMHDLLAQPLGVLVLHTPLEAFLDESQEALIQMEMNRRNLEDGIAAITEPYVGIFGEVIPSPDNNERNWRGKLKSDPVTTTPIETVRIIDDVEVAYGTSVTYQPNIDHNSLLSAKVNIANKSGNPTQAYESMRLNLHYNKGALERIMLGPVGVGMVLTNAVLDIRESSNWTQNIPRRRKVSAQKVPSNDTSLGKFLSDTIHYGDVQFNLTGEAPAIILKDNHSKLGGCEYRYDPNRDEFMRIGSDTFDRYERSGTYEGNRPDKLTNVEFLTILASTLRLIPTLER